MYNWKNLLVALLVLAVLGVAGYFLYQKYAPKMQGAKTVAVDGIKPYNELDYRIESTQAPAELSESSTPQASVGLNEDVLPYPQISNGYSSQEEYKKAMGISCGQVGGDVLTAPDLLPKATDKDYMGWNEASPSPQGTLSDQNFLSSGHHYGINTVGQSLKNPNYQLRSDPSIPQIPTGPWQQSTIEADTNRKMFEIGGC